MIKTGTIEVGATLSNLTEIQQKQLPFAISLALTRAASQAAKDLRNSWRLNSNFTKRNRWIENQIGFEPASKRAAQPESAVTWRVSFMSLHEEGGTRTAKHEFLAVPMAGLRGSRVIPKELRPSALLGSTAGLKASVPRSAAGVRRKLQRSQYVGQGFVLQRGNKRFIAVRSADGRRLKLMYRLIRSSRVFARLGAFEAVKESVAKNFPGAFSTAMEQAIKTAKR